MIFFIRREGGKGLCILPVPGKALSRTLPQEPLESASSIPQPCPLLSTVLRRPCPPQDRRKLEAVTTGNLMAQLCGSPRKSKFSKFLCNHMTAFKVRVPLHSDIVLGSTFHGKPGCWLTLPELSSSPGHAQTCAEGQEPGKQRPVLPRVMSCVKPQVRSPLGREPPMPPHMHILDWLGSK